VKPIQLNIYGVQAEIHISGEHRQEFSYFLAPAVTPTISFFLEETKKTRKPHSPFLFQTQDCSVHGWGRFRHCKYGMDGDVWTESSKEKRRFEISHPDKNELLEISFMAFLSAVGEALDGRGYHRVHALGFEYKGMGLLAVLPQGGGKSALAALKKKDPSFRIFSDENPLVKDGVMYPYPHSLALHEKVVRGLDLDFKEGYLFSRKNYSPKLRFPWASSQIAKPIPVSVVLCGERSTPHQIRPCHGIQTIKALSSSMVLGLGLAQMKEYMLRISSIHTLSKIASMRAREAFRIARQSKSYSYGIGYDAKKNDQVFTEFLDSL